MQGGCTLLVNTAPPSRSRTDLCLMLPVSLLGVHYMVDIAAGSMYMHV